ncbi:tail tube A [Synechococcus phage S-RIP1]|uniref:Tail tube A n=1 Tax=Synechococcus phage S-RIP1 TaxID=754041 RepID=M4NUW8_9CAUD|nr:tail tube A [Synechococcus phage S-RIP1]AGG91244.1 tail tube A [Synechococcus phage S-RIP1]
MPYPTTGPNTELQAVNQILASVGQAPVTTLATETTYTIEQIGSFVGSITGTVLSTDEVLGLGTYISGAGITNNTTVVTASSPSATSFAYDYTLNLSSSATGNITMNKAVVSYEVETQTNPDVAIAYNTLTEVTREVQSEGWVYNTERNYDGLQPDASTKKITIPNNVIQADLSQDYVNNLGRNVVNRGGVLYDTITHTDVWNTDETLYLDILWEFEYENIPQPIQAYIVARAAAIVSSRVIGDPNQYQMLQQKEAYARAMALEYDCNQGDHSFFGAPQNGNYYKAYSPFNTLIR